eukprot:jgi/Astpho2/6985/Aster-x1412
MHGWTALAVAALTLLQGVLSQTLVSSTAAPVVLASPQPGSPVPVATAVPIVTPSPSPTNQVVQPSGVYAVSGPASMPNADPADFPLLTGVIPGLNVTSANAPAGTLQLLGRWFPDGQPNVSVLQLLPGGAPVRASWSGSMILGSFSGPGATCNLQDAINRGAFGDYLDIFVDNMTIPLHTVQLTSTPSDVPLSLQPLNNSSHLFKIVKRTEGAVNDMVCIGFVVRLSYVVRVELSTQGLACQVSGGPASSPTSSALPTEAPVVMVPPSMPTRQILSIGDSIAAGFGVMCANSSGGGLNPYQFENAQLTAASRLGGMFGAGVTIIAESGGGAQQNDNCTSTDTVPDIFPLASRQLTVDFNFTNTPRPQVILVNLGTNDWKCNNIPGVPYVNAYTSLIQSLRSLWGNTPYIIHEVGPMLGSGLAEQTRALLQGIIDNFAAAGDTNQTVVVLPYDDGSSGYGCNQHPNAITHLANAVQLQPTVARVTGWQSITTSS